MESGRKHFIAYLLLGLVMMLWAGNAVVGRATRFDIGPLTLAFLRWALATALVMPFAFPALRREWRSILAHWKIVLALGLLGVGMFNALLYSGLQHTTATNALLLQAATPATVMLLDRLVFGTRASALQLLGVIVSIGGVMAIVFEGDPAAALGLNFGRGDLLVLAGVAVWSLYTILLRLRPPIEASSFIAATFLIGLVVMAPVAAWEYAGGARVDWGPGVFAGLAYVAVLASILAYFLFNSATATVGAARAGQAITLMPLFGALLSAGLLGEKLYPYHFAGMALILAGIALGALTLHRKTGAGTGAGAPLEDLR
jgi:drug/metabolite transporter (DMT)-like permease